MRFFSLVVIILLVSFLVGCSSVDSSENINIFDSTAKSNSKNIDPDVMLEFDNYSLFVQFYSSSPASRRMVDDCLSKTEDNKIDCYIAAESLEDCNIISSDEDHLDVMRDFFSPEQEPGGATRAARSYCYSHVCSMATDTIQRDVCNINALLFTGSGDCDVFYNNYLKGVCESYLLLEPDLRFFDRMDVDDLCDFLVLPLKDNCIQALSNHHSSSVYCQYISDKTKRDRCNKLAESKRYS